MDCDRCGRTIEEGAMVSVGARRFRNLCRTCWMVETRSSNSKLISALNEMTRGHQPSADRRGAEVRTERAAEARSERLAERGDVVLERRRDPDRPHWHS